MFPLGLTVLSGFYIIKRLQEKKQDKNITHNELDKITTHNELDKEEKEKQINHHLKVNTLALTTNVIGHVFYPAKLLSLGLISYNMIPILKETEKSLLVDKEIKNNFLNSIIGVVCIGSGEYLSATLVTGLYHLGDKMVIKTKDRSIKMLGNTSQQADKAWLVLDDGSEIETNIKKVKPNDIISVNTGNMIPVNGQIIEGSAIVDQQALTGESLLSKKTTGDNVLANTFVISGKVLVKIHHDDIDTNAEKIRYILHHTAEYKTDIQSNSENLADKVALPLIGVAGLLSPIIGIIPATALLYSSPGNSIKTFVSLQTENYLVSLSKLGILIKDGRALEELLKVDTILFDKTSTLTMGEPIVGNIMTCSELSQIDIMHYAATAEYQINHPIAHAILNYAKDHHIATTLVNDAHYEIGYGISVHIDNTIIQAGSLQFMEMENIEIPPQIQQAQINYHKQGHAIVAVAIDKEIKGIIEIKQQLKSETKVMLKTLRQHNINYIGILSDDRQQATQQLAKELNMDGYFYDVLPQDKVTIIADMQKQGRKVCFIGNGLNDSIAIKQANVSISFTEENVIDNDLVQILMDKNISHLPQIFEAAEKLSVDTKRILAMLAGIATLTSVGAVFLQMRIVGAVGLQCAENVMGFGYSLRPLKEKNFNKK